MPAALRDTGCCPVCGSLVPRLVARLDHRPQEVYLCPRDGTIGYGPQPVTLQGWVERLAPTAAARARLAMPV